MHRLVRAIFLGASIGASIGACGHADTLVITELEGAAPGRVERAADLRHNLRAQAREARRRPKHSFTLLPSGLPDMQAPHPEWNALVDRGQHTGSDIAGPVKAHGEHLVMIREHRLVVVSVGASMRVVADEPLGPSYEPSLLIHGDQVFVVLPGMGPYRRRKHIEVRRFTIAGDGRLTDRSSIHLRGHFSVIPAVARIAGGSLVLHVQSSLGVRTPDIIGLPAIWRAGRWQPLVRATELQRPLSAATTAQIIVRCDLGAGSNCDASGVLAQSTFYRQHDDEATFVWSAEHVWRMPIDGSAATAVRVVGRPLDLLAWRLDRGDVDAVVATGDRVGLLHIGAASLRAGLRSLTAADLQPLAATQGQEFATRFIGDRLVYADGPDWACDGETTLRVRSLTSGEETTMLVPHCVGRIEAIGAHALVIGAPHEPPNMPVQLTAVDLSATPALGDTRIYTDVVASYLRSAGAYNLGGTLRGLPAEADARTRVITQDGPHLREHGTIAAGEWREYAFTYADRIYVLHDAGLVEHELRGEVVSERRRLALTSALRPGR